MAAGAAFSTGVGVVLCVDWEAVAANGVKPHRCGFNVHFFHHGLHERRSSAVAVVYQFSARPLDQYFIGCLPRRTRSKAPAPTRSACRNSHPGLLRYR